ncbi:hypothetical protein [Saccharopolyspora endophytica]|uniref:Transposase n=1 Tax=Saccharopolyspora endophytica TaxID=543886 RepID=A0ABS5DKC6_9PSEU|nr:hypothetical protein [Saccharopolyspora endophytica]MBQ0926743.1 hypothetical protein [Saccharopolyspora endophytica]
MITYRAILDVPRDLALYLARLLATHRRELGTRTGRRALSPFGQAVLGLRWFRDNTAIARLARDHGISRATAYRYLDEVTDVLADQHPDLHESRRQAKDDGWALVICNGKIFSSGRVSGKTISVKRTVIDRWCRSACDRRPTSCRAEWGANGGSTRRMPRPRAGSALVGQG